MVEDNAKEKHECNCPNKQILDMEGRFAIELLRAHNKGCYALSERGISWERLSHVLDIEELEGDMIICEALNKKNDNP